MKPHRSSPAALALAGLLLGCAAPVAQPRTPRPPTATMNPQAQRVFDLVNAKRVALGLRPLAISFTCTAAAQDHAADMVQRKFFSHRSPTESFESRMRRWGLLEAAVAENIGRAETPEAVVKAWMGSRGHRANILDDAHLSSGVGFADARYVQCFSAVTGD